MSNHNEQDSFFETVTQEKELPIGFEQLEQQAETILDPHGFGYIQSGAGNEETLRKNEQAFEKRSIIPRFLTDVSDVDTSIQLLNRRIPFPVVCAPIGMQQLAHVDGEIASSRAAARLNIPFIQSTVSSYSIEDLSTATKQSPKWFQLYWSSNENVSYSMVERAESAGYEAIVITVDTVQMGWREVDLRNQFSPLKLGLGKANYEQDPVFMKSLPKRDRQTIVDHIIKNIYHPHLQWDHLKKLKERTSLPILLKGILHVEDAKLALELGVDGILVSNHGGRQLDGVISSIEALPHIVQEINGRIPVLFDSGIRRGTDIIKALCLGATAVSIGRPYIYALAVDGEQGVYSYLHRFMDEFTTSMKLTGASTIEELRSTTII